MTPDNHLHCIREGEGPVVVLSHALGCDVTMWDGVAALLDKRFTVLRYDARGHGQSGVPPGPYTLDMLADDAARLITDEVGGPVHFVGLSMGGMTAQALATRHPALVASITVANSSMFFEDDAKAVWLARMTTVRAKGMEAVADGAMQRWFTPEFRADIGVGGLSGGADRVAALRERLVANEPHAYAFSCEAVALIDFRISNPRLACPALVIGGTRDDATPVAMSRAIADSIVGAQLATLDAAHLSAVEQPAAFVALLTEFLESLPV
ncbi:MAG: alpha/beta fold hydrolase [Polaromonas sp.]|nr:alpha/beta fold hydrolase [Polaromonas sp.]